LGDIEASLPSLVDHPRVDVHAFDVEQLPKDLHDQTDSASDIECFESGWRLPFLGQYLVLQEPHPRLL
jgi:hypothetical protein